MNTKRPLQRNGPSLPIFHRRPGALRLRPLAALLIGLVLVGALVTVTPVPVRGAEATPTPGLTSTNNPPGGPTRTPFPPEYLSNSQEATGMIIASIVLVLIVIFGVVAFMPKNSET